ncbi:MAG: hypothetical protein R3C32_04130 [Chloroflexota bacterium]
MVPADEFASVLYPFWSPAAGVRVRQVPLGELPGRPSPLDDHRRDKPRPDADRTRGADVNIVEAARPHGTRILVDATQSVPVTPPGRHR